MNVTWLGILIGIIIGFILFYVLFEIRDRCLIQNESAQVIQTLIRQTARWSNAALQDKSPIIALLHSNYGAGYLWALTDAFTTDQIKVSSQMSESEYRDFRNKVVSIQDNATKKLAKLCQPALFGLDPNLSKLAGEG